MRKITSILLGAGILLSLAGCQKGTTSDNEGKLIQFGAKSGAPTRTAYSGQGTAGSDGELTWERIDWVEGDEVLIGSDKAFGRKGGTNRYANYRIYGVQANGNISTASIADNDGKGLVWGEEPAYTFYGIYPASAGDANIADGSATFTIATPQSPKDGKTDMEQAVMLAKVSGVAPNQTVDLHFYPAYTAFEFVLTAANTDVNLTKVELVSDSDLVGTVTAAIAEGTTTNSAGQTIGASSFSDPTDAGKVLTYNFPSGTKVTKDGDPLTFTVFALPVDVVKLKLRFYTNDTDFQLATLKKKVDGVQTDEVTFDACRKHKIYGLAIPDGQWHLYLEADVLDWIEAKKTIQYGNATADGVVVSASALEPITGATSWSRTAATVESTSFVRAYYSVYSPTNGKWRITLKGENAGHFTIATSPAGTTGTDADGNAYIQGAVDGRIIFTVTPTSEAASGESVELWFTVVMVEGEGDAAVEKQYLLHSEVTRSNKPLTVTVL